MAERLAQKLDYACLSREEMVEAAIKDGIHVGKLEMAMLKPSIFSERLAVEKEHYRAFSTAYLCDRAEEGRLVYHGRTGHLLLPGVSHVLRLRVVTSDERRVRAAMSQLGLDHEKAVKYIEDVDEDWNRWVSSMYQTSWEDAGQYDLTVNLEQMSVDNAVAALIGVAQLPDFQMTPASKRTMHDLALAARTRLALARDERTSGAGFKVWSQNGSVSLTYLPKDSSISKWIPEVVSTVPDIKEFSAAMASTNILWIQETFDANSEAYREVVKIANKWNAAVELVRLYQGEEAEEEEAPAEAGEVKSGVSEVPAEYNGGIEDDVDEPVCEDGGMTDALRELAGVGRSGGGHIVCGGAKDLMKSISKSNPYTLVVIGDVFNDLGHETKMRETRELQSYVTDRIKAPVVTSDELKAQYLFGVRDVFKLVGYLIVVLIVYFLVFTHQEPILKFVSGTWSGGGMMVKAAVSVAVFLFVPFIAYTYGNVAKSLMKLINME